MNRIFDLMLERKRYPIAPWHEWEHLFNRVDVLRLMRLMHRDWHYRHGQPPAFVTEGCIFVRRDFRFQVYEAFRGKVDVSGTRFQYALVHLVPDLERFVENHIKRRVETNWPGFQDKSPEEQVEDAHRHYRGELEHSVDERERGLLEDRFMRSGDSDEIVDWLRGHFGS